MAENLLFRGGNTADVNNSATTINDREIVIDTESNQIVLGSSKERTVMEDGTLFNTGSSVGVGTSTPVNLLSVKSNNRLFNVHDDGLSNYTTVSGTNTSGSPVFLRTVGERHHFGKAVDGSDDKMVINSDGNVSIGKTNADERLEVVGTITTDPSIYTTTDKNVTSPLTIGTIGTNTNGGHLQGEGSSIAFELKRSSNGGTINTAFIKAEAEADLGQSWPTSLVFGTKRFGSTPVEHLRIASTGDATFSGTATFDGTVTIDGNAVVGTDIRMANGVLALSYVDDTNIDHIWHDDNANTFIFNSDTTRKNTTATGNVKARSFESAAAGEGIIMASSNGTRYRLTVNNDGTLNTALA